MYLTKGIFLLFSKMCDLFADTKPSAMLQSELLQNMQPYSSGSDTGSTAPGVKLNLGEITVLNAGKVMWTNSKEK